MKNLFKFILYCLLGKSIKLDIDSTVSKFYVAELQTEKKWDGVETITVVLKTIDSLKIKPGINCFFEEC